LEADIRNFLAAHNDEPRPFIWTRTADQILEGLERYCTKANAVNAERARRTEAH